MKSFVKDKRIWLSFLLIFAIIGLGIGGVLLASRQNPQEPAQVAVSPEQQETAVPEETINAEDAEAEPESPMETAAPDKTVQPKPERAASTAGGEAAPAAPASSAPVSAGEPAAAETTAPPPTEAPQKAEQVTLSIRVPDEERYILSPVKVDLEGDDTVLSVLQRATQERQIQMEFSGGKKNAYVEGIDNLYEFSKGAGSGWMYTVNGTVMGKSCGGVQVKDGDEIRWIYTLDLGKDIQ